ncbi:MAG TPA: NnrU family protein [Steroidobacteraceae bacterium]
MSELIIGLAIFLGSHSIGMTVPQWRTDMIRRIGDRAWMGFYSLVSIASLVLIVHGFAVARRAPILLYVPPPLLHTVAVVLMVPVPLLVLASVLPGKIQAVTKHPLLLAVKVWALAHLLANGTAADVLLFGSLLIWAGLVRVSLKRRPRRPRATVPTGRWNDAVVVMFGLALYVAFLLWFHQWLFGVAPLG